MNRVLKIINEWCSISPVGMYDYEIIEFLNCHYPELTVKFFVDFDQPVGLMDNDSIMYYNTPIAQRIEELLGED